MRYRLEGFDPFPHQPLHEQPGAAPKRKGNLRSFLRGLNAGGMLAGVMSTKPRAAVCGLLISFRVSSIVGIGLHNAMRGCFATQVRER